MSGAPFILIANCDAEWGLGRDGALLVRIREDMRRFRELTLGHTVVYGSKTLGTFPHGKPLRERRNIILSQTLRGGDPALEGAEVCPSVESALTLLASSGGKTFIIGGGAVYRAFLPYCGTALITRLSRAYGADTFFPNLDTAPDWILTDPGRPMGQEDIPYRFCVYTRK